MRILTRHLLVQLLTVFVFSLTALTAMIMIGVVLKEAVNQGLPILQTLRLIPFFLPEVLRIALPVTLLLATTSVYARMSGSNEVIAIKALGISPWVILWPSLLVAFLLSLFTVWMNDLAVSWGRQGVQRVVIEAVEEIVYGMLQTQKGYSSPRFSINVKRVEGRRLILPLLTIAGRGTSPMITISAEEAEIRTDRKENVLKIILHSGTVEMDGRVSFRFPGDVYEQEIPLSDASRANPADRRPSSMALREIPDQIAATKVAIEGLQEEMASLAGQQMLCGEFETLTGDDWKRRQEIHLGLQEQLFRLYTEPHRRWSAGFSCLCFVWVGAPMAIWLRNRDFLTSFFLCFLPILIVYYPLLMYGVDGAKNGTIPSQSVWVGNVILLVWGALMLRKVLRY
jgi:lipopolysaccharide export system permease protein